MLISRENEILTSLPSVIAAINSRYSWLSKEVHKSILAESTGLEMANHQRLTKIYGRPFIGTGLLKNFEVSICLSKTSNQQLFR